MENTSKHFVLIHGVCHGAWCWYKVSSLLKQAGHRVTAIDLGASGVNPKRLDEVPRIEDYLQPLMDFMATLPEEEKVVLVGHSYGGLSISKAMESFPRKISLAVFVSAYLPDCRAPPGNLILEYFSRTTLESLMDCQLGFDGIENPPTSALFGPEFLKANPYQLCELQDLELSRMLVRPSGLYVNEWTSDDYLLTEENFGSVKKAYIVLEDDQTMKQDFQQWMIQNSYTQLDEVKLFKDCGHMIMLTKPREFCLCLQEIAN